MHPGPGLPFQRVAPLLHVLGLVVLIFSFSMLAPLVTAFFACDESFAVTLLTGPALCGAAEPGRW